jgi:hypothetical protein
LPTVHIPLPTVHSPLTTGQLSMFKTWPINITLRSKLLPKNTIAHLGGPWRKRDCWY